MPQYRIEFLNNATTVVRVMPVDAGSRAKASLLVAQEIWPPDAVAAYVVDKRGRRGPSVSRPPVKPRSQGANEDEFVAQWRERLASNPRFTEDKRTGGGIIRPGARTTTPLPDPESMPRRTPQEAKLIASLEKALGRTLIEGEDLLVLGQARAFWELLAEASARRRKLG